MFTVISIALARKQLRDGYEHRFVERFWTLEDKRLQAKYDGPPTGPVEHERYLRLCEDEYEAMGLGGVSFRTWNVWHEAVRHSLSPNTEVRRILETLPGDEYSLLRRCLFVEPHSSGRCPSLARRQRVIGAVLGSVTSRAIQ
ncbi:MAG: hypothetical protein ACJ72L_18605 [Marmoricola sp.]